MMTRVLRSSLVALALGSLSAATVAAQPPDPEGGDVWVPPPDNSQQQQQQQQQPPQQRQGAWYNNGQNTQQPAHTGGGGSVSTSPVNTVEEYDNHERVVHRVAIGYMGIQNVPIGYLAGDAGAPAASTVPAIALGFRYWINDLVGLDVGLGFGYAGGNTTNRMSNGTTCPASESCPTSDGFGLLLHGGIPIAFFHETHYSFLIIPELNLGFSTGSQRPTDNSDNDVGLSGFMFRIGGRVGTEIHFGFMNIPSLSVQASVGLYFDYLSASANPRGGGGSGSSSYGIATTIISQPWDIFNGTIQALYYF